ncbi:hypothetical protein FOT61_06260 [Serratia marcescens]|uniref:hypothetical protein n=1 Tax=Serratia nevei TaxID=2703794 RepID=UPI0009311A95|nr:hypothetical protein DX900_06950 [Serratia marcescens]TFZ84327.1 hypothetical protein E4655_19580 [Serratia marcescens]TXE42463.1 hypothetical protein FOT61_06260 [Serratia marcescens]
MKQELHEPRSRLPRGIAAKNPIPMRLSEDERAELEAIATRESRSSSSMARLIFLRGLESFTAE